MSVEHDEIQRLYEWIHREVTARIEDRMSREQMIEFERLICDNPIARRLYLQYINESVGLHWMADAQSLIKEPGVVQSAGDEDCDWTLPVAELIALEESAADVQLVDLTHQCKNEAASLSRLLEKPVEEKAARDWYIYKSVFYGGVAAMVALLLVMVWPSTKPTPSLAPAPLTTVDAPPQVVARLQHSLDAQPADNDAPPKVVARLQHSLDAQWEEASGVGQILVLQDGDDLRPGALKLTRGLAELKLESGAVVLIESPCEINLTSRNDLVLNAGKLVANVPGQAKGFTVNTPTSQIVDFGTEFGVRVGQHAVTEVHVYQGWVQAAFGRQLQPLDLTQGQARRFHAASDRVESISVDEQQFVRNWTQAMLRPQVVGDIQYFAKIPDSLEMDQFEHSSRAALFLENNHVALTGPLAVSAASPGSHTFDSQRQTAIHHGRRVTSYLLHYDVKDERVGVESTVTGEIRFNQPIIGVFGDIRQLQQTDALLGSPQVRYSSDDTRGVEVDSGINKTDVVALSADRKTLRFNISAANMDQFRILTQAPTSQEAP